MGKLILTFTPFFFLLFSKMACCSVIHRMTIAKIQTFTPPLRFSWLPFAAPTKIFQAPHSVSYFSLLSRFE